MAQVVQVGAPIPTNINVSMDASSDDDTSSGNSKEDDLQQRKRRSNRNQFSAPLGLFASASLFDNSNRSSSGTSAGDECMSVQTTQSKRLGIARPSYGDSALIIDDDATTKASTAASARIGIVRPNNYDLAEGEMPLSPLDLYLDKKKASSPTPNLIEADDSESTEDNLWQLQLLQSQQQQTTTTARAQLQVMTTTTTSQTSQQQQQLPNDNVDRLVHKQTSEGHYLVNSRPLDSPMAGMKYSLTGGKKAMASNQRRASYDSTSVKTRPNAIVPTESPDKSAASFKIFLLLIQPKSKIFEIIQVFYSPSQTTIQNVLAMIPANATEPALGSQSYVGLCRPKDGQPIQVEFMASSASATNVGCAKILQGEILVAIPEQYSGTFCAKIAKPILSNPKVTKLLTRSDPLAPSKRKKKKKRSHRSSSNSGSGGNTIAIETVKEETESLDTDASPTFAQQQTPVRKNMKEERSQQEKDALRMALQHAAREAASTNAEVRSDNGIVSDAGDSASLGDDCDIPVEMWKTTMSLKSRASTLHRSDSIGDSSTIASFSEFDGNQSVNSLDTTDYQYKRMPRRARRTAKKSVVRMRRKKQARLLAAVVFAMICRYIMVAQQRLATAATTVTDAEESSAMFGLFGLIQVVLAFFAFVKTQRYLEGRGEIQDCPFVQFVSTVWKRSQQQLNKARRS